ncbi:hypothetical protein MARPO_0018s0031 [Marchantia polymorpha]|uniref:Uncharacterized protein n=1 Tax=Marchantia polymorpha TaxID=3197 RepID=A0A2R6XFF2_MARPO|nr:hypothetical protein MARPO_0018s0031 [Marchantia polymorpha]|eukprot:PTQ44840.1 hypothetical protein MARPO_0018s0031 [Marchantia polymorpha]
MSLSLDVSALMIVTWYQSVKESDSRFFRTHKVVRGGEEEQNRAAKQSLSRRKRCSKHDSRQVKNAYRKQID